MSKEHACMRFVLLVALLVGCSTRPNPKSCLDNHCSDPDLPFCDVDGSIGGEPNTCIAVECQPNQFEECRGSRALTCNATGDNFDLVACEFGCGAAGCVACDTPECEKHIIPKYLPSVCNELSANPLLMIGSDTELNTDQALACSAVVPQAMGPEICVLHYTNIKIETNRIYSITGSRALALVADRTLVLDGVLDASANASTNGPGGGLVASGTGQGNAGGGAGYRTPGGNGGTASVDGGAANGGAAGPAPTTLTHLVGGARPTKGTNGGNPGGGGGAVTLVSCRGMVSVVGTIDVGGGGGAGNRFPLPTGPNVFAAGGGSGGTVVIQGLDVSITGQIYANGGGGGGGGDVGSSGADGTRSTTGAAGGAPAGLNPTTGYGGRGGAVAGPGAGEKLSTGEAGAGGGSAGYIVIHTPVGVFPTVMPFAVSPGIEPKQDVPTN